MLLYPLINFRGVVGMEKDLENIEEIEKSIKGYELCAKLAEVNSVISAAGASVSTLITGNPDTFSLVMLGISAAFLSYDAYQIYKLENKATNEENTKVKQLIKTNTQNIKSNL